MLEKTSEYLTNQLYIKGEIEQNKIEIIQYGFEIFLSSAFILFSIPLYAAIMFKLSEGMVFLAFFMPIRLFSGGYHATTYRKCYICTISLFIVTVISSYLLPIKNIIFVLVALTGSSVYIFINAPCINEHHPLTESRYRKNKLQARITVIIESIMSIILYWINKGLCTVSVYTLLLVVGMMIFSMKEEKKIC